MKWRLGRAGIGLSIVSGAAAGLGHALAIIGALTVSALVLLALCNQIYPVIQTKPFKLTWKRIERPPRR